MAHGVYVSVHVLHYPLQCVEIRNP